MSFLQRYFKKETPLLQEPNQNYTDLGTYKMSNQNSHSLNINKIDVIFLLDVSISMGNRINILKKTRRIDILRRIMKNYENYKYISFSNQIYPLKIPEPSGTTDLGEALEYIYSAYDCNNIILITDGEPDNENFMLCMLRLDIPIHIIYIGKENDEGEIFSRKLCLKTNGKLICVYEANEEIFENRLQLAANSLIT